MNQREWSQADVEQVPFGDIVVGDRRREKLGPIGALAKSIEENGLIHPIVVTSENILVAGRRRLAAMEKLGWKKIPVRRFDDMSDDDLRTLEVEENTRRLDLSDYELSRKMVSEAEAEKVRTGSAVSKGGRGNKSGNRAAAKELGVDEKTIRQAKKHVAAAESHPAFQAKDWKKSQVLAASEALETIPMKDQRAVVEMVTGPGVDTKSAVKMLETLAEKPAPERKAIIQLYKSDDPAKKSLAFTRAAKLPPVPPKVLGDLDQAIRWIDKAADRETTLASKYRAASKSLCALRELEEKDYEQLKAAEG